MSGMTRTKMLSERRCGLKYYDKAVLLVGHHAIIDQTILYYKQSTTTMGTGWDIVRWAFVNAVKDLINCDKDITQTYNLMDVLRENDIVYFQNKLNLTGNPPDVWARKK